MKRKSNINKSGNAIKAGIRNSELYKKAIIQVQLNWIFVTIIGAIILFFFITIVTKQKDISELQMTNEIVRDLDDLITGARTATGGASQIPLPDVKLEFECNEYRVNNQRLPIGSRIVFGASKIKDKAIIVWSVPWNLPYEVTDFLFVTAPNIKYVFAYDFNSQFAQQYHDLFLNYIPDQLNKIEVDIADDKTISFPNENNYRTKIIAIGDTVYPPDFAINEKTTIVQIQRYNPNIEHFTDPVEFWQYNGIDWFELEGRTTFIDKSSLMGAMFSDTAAEYNCVMNKVFQNLNALNKVHMQRTNMLVDANLPTNLYQESLPYFESIDDSTQNPELWEENVAELFNSAKELDRQNSRIEQMSLPLLY